MREYTVAEWKLLLISLMKYQSETRICDKYTRYLWYNLDICVLNNAMATCYTSICLPNMLIMKFCLFVDFMPFLVLSLKLTQLQGYINFYHNYIHTTMCMLQIWFEWMIDTTEYTVYTSTIVLLKWSYCVYVCLNNVLDPFMQRIMKCLYRISRG